MRRPLALSLLAWVVLGATGACRPTLDPSQFADPCAIAAPAEIREEVRVIANGQQQSVEATKTTLLRFEKLAAENQRCAIVSKVSTCCVMRGCTVPVRQEILTTVARSCTAPVAADPTNRCIARCDMRRETRLRLRGAMRETCMQYRRSGCFTECLPRFSPEDCADKCDPDRDTRLGITNQEYWANKCRKTLTGWKLDIESEHGVCRDGCVRDND